MKRKLAIFDIDGTIFRSSLLIELVSELVAREIFPKRSADRIEKDYIAWVNRAGHYDNYIARVIEVYLDNIKGARESEVKKAVRKVVNEHKDKVYRFTRDLIKRLKKEKYFLLAVSGSPIHIVSEFTKQLDFDGYFGSEFEISGGKFTGHFTTNMQKNKKKTLEKFLDQNKNQLTLQNSIGVGDTESDIPLLDAVENPIAFNPNIELAKHAKKKRWRIMVERKDVIYDVRDFKIISH